MDPLPSYTVRKMTREDVPQTLDIWRETGMQQGINSLYSWMQVDPGAINIAVTDEGEVIGACSAFIHHDDLAFVGMYCVRKKFRGLGVGTKVWASCMDHAGGRNVVLNAVPERLKLYRDTCNIPIVETSWVWNINETSPKNDPIHPEKLSDTPPAGVDIVPLEETHLPLVFDYDLRLIGYDRQKCIELSTKEPDARAYVAIRDGACVGFGIAKPSCQDCAQVGPLYADDKAVAEVLLKKLILSLPTVKGFSMMTLSCNGPANEFIERLGCPKTEECPRLYRKAKVEVDKSKVFGGFDLNFQLY